MKIVAVTKKSVEMIWTHPHGRGRGLTNKICFLLLWKRSIFDHKYLYTDPESQILASSRNSDNTQNVCDIIDSWKPYITYCVITACDINPDIGPHISVDRH